MGEVIPLWRPQSGYAAGDGGDGRYCSTCGAKRDTSPSCQFCGSTAWQTFPIIVGGSNSTSAPRP